MSGTWQNHKWCSEMGQIRNANVSASQWFVRMIFYIVSKVKQFLYRPRQALSFSGGWGSQISWQSAHDGCKFIRPRQRPPSPPRKYSRYSHLLEADSTPGLWWGRKDCVNEKFKWNYWESNPRPSDLKYSVLTKCATTLPIMLCRTLR